MCSSCCRSGRTTRSRARDRLDRELSHAGTHQVAFALGVGEDDTPSVTDTLYRIAGAKIELTFSQLRYAFEHRGHPAYLDDGHVEYALAMLAVAFGARDAMSVNRSVFDVAGGLYMPPLVILLSTLLHQQWPGELP